MNKQELQGAFSKIHASDELIKEVLSVEKEQKKVGFTWRRGLRLAATAATLVAIFFGAMAFWSGETEPDEPGIVAVPGVMKVYAAEWELTEIEDTAIECPIEGIVDSNLPIWTPFSSVAGFGIPLTLCVPESLWGDVKISFDVSAEYGYFLDQKIDAKNLGSDITIDNREKVHWRGNSIFEIEEAVGEDGEFYADIIIRADGRIVGYGVIAFVYVDGSCIAYSVVTRGYPLVNGEYQNITEDLVMEEIEKLK